MKYKITIIFLLVFLGIPLIIAGNTHTYGTTKLNECIDVYQICENCTYNNISSILYPNKTIAEYNLTMDRDDTYYNSSFCNTTQLGQYIVNGHGDLDGTKTAWTNDFEVTGTGAEFTESTSTFYLGMFAVLFILFGITLFSIPKLPNGNDADDYGLIMGINKLKYLRPVLYATAWGLLLGILFTASAVSLAYLGNEIFGKLLFAIYSIMMWVSVPGVILWGFFIFIQIFRDIKVKQLLERGIDVQSTI